jgi:hypothetical protein
MKGMSYKGKGSEGGDRRGKRTGDVLGVMETVVRLRTRNRSTTTALG